MRFHRKYRDVSFARTIGPEHPPSCRCLILEIGLENFDPVLAAQIFDFVRCQAVVSGIRGKITKSFDPLLEKLFLRLAEFSCLLTRRKIVPERLHVRHSHTDPEGHEMDLSFDECGEVDRRRGRPFFKLATDLSSVLKERAEI